MKFFIHKIIKYIILPFGILYRMVNRENEEIIILMYHRVNDKVKKELSVKEKDFKWQMRYLKRKGYSLLTMDEVFRKIKDNKIKGRHIVLSFDDGYEDYITNAFPILYQYGFPSILYLVPGYIDHNKVFWWDKDLGKSDLLSWQQILKLKENNLVEIGSHTQHHLDLDKLEEDQLAFEIKKSKEEIENRLNNKVCHFSYPRGIYNKVAEKIIFSHYDTGVLILNGIPITPFININYRTRLKRTPIQRSDGKILFIARIKGWLVLEEVLRKIAGFLRE
ncbi:MAG TPA: polysaccharide deacetylase family protein [Eubacteriaceae bacterium]|nr:polysaccharide deacetylase family protein [Eubacteriaceae bacterium]